MLLYYFLPNAIALSSSLVIAQAAIAVNATNKVIKLQ